METHSAAKGVAAVAVVVVAVAVAVADKQRQQQHYTHHYVERFSVIDDMGPVSRRGSLRFPSPPVSFSPSLSFSLASLCNAQRRPQRATLHLLCWSEGESEWGSAHPTKGNRVQFKIYKSIYIYSLYFSYIKAPSNHMMIFQVSATLLYIYFFEHHL